jgi:hypothetical protein
VTNQGLKDEKGTTKCTTKWKKCLKPIKEKGSLGEHTIMHPHPTSHKISKASDVNQKASQK